MSAEHDALVARVRALYEIAADCEFERWQGKRTDADLASWAERERLADDVAAAFAALQPAPPPPLID